MKSAKRSSFLCPNCRKLIGADEKVCPHCGIARPGAWWQNNGWMRGLDDPRRIIWLIIAVNTGMYLISLLLHPRFSNFSFHPLALLAPENKSLLILGATGTIPIGQFHWWWTLVSANYLHGSILHIFFNMFALRQVGPLVIHEYGPYRMILIYTLGGIAAFSVSYLAGVRFTIGASGAICALIGAMLYYGKSRGGLYGNTIYRQLGGWVLGIFLLGMMVPGINNWGHGGGIVAGILFGYLLKYREKSPQTRLHKVAAGLCALLTLAVLCRALIGALVYRFA